MDLLLTNMHFLVLPELIHILLPRRVGDDAFPPSRSSLADAADCQGDKGDGDGAENTSCDGDLGAFGEGVEG